MPKKASSKKSAPQQVEFEAALKELETLVSRMEKGELSLEESLKDFERGVQLTRQCQTALRDAEQKVQILLQENKHAELANFEED